ncbi:PREDICTED: uncharacterized protein LOC107173150 isoform X3 [Diuraphis noxia]|uniref:uncharacterized protein LOC107173150 isoform X3 n=1 Tax=Diuraphis noxia TaxID=143948 RepID=UPI0007638AE7|nr:PREDICTED: uncharacterized protein LOC107173150 isoform X3 [Diuraphis noxia]
MAQLLNISFKKNDLYSSWGFQVCGGRDSWRPLTVRNVQNGTLAYNYLSVGDRVLEIDGIDCYSLTESQAISFLRRPSNSIELLILKRRGENVVPPKRSSSCKALQNFVFPKHQSISEPCSPRHQIINNNIEISANSENQFREFEESDNKCLKRCFEEPNKEFTSLPIKNENEVLQFSNFKPRRNSLQKDGELVFLRSRSSSPQFWKTNVETSVTGPPSDCKSFWKKLEKCSMEDLSVRRTPSPVRPASVAFYSKTPEPIVQSKAEIVSARKKVTFSNVLLERNYLQMDLPDLSPGSRVDEEFNKIYNSSRQEEQHQIGAKDLAAGDMSAPPPPAPPPLPYSGGTIQGGPPPPPPPPMLHSGHIPAIRIKTELNEPREIPSTIQNAMATKDKKPFTYLPGGLDLSEIRSPRMQRRLERNAQTPPSPEEVPQKSPDYQQQQEMKPNCEQKPVCNVRSASERVCLLPQVQHQPLLNKSPTPWMQKAAQIQPSLAPWTQNKKEYVDQVDKTEERVIPVRVEINKPTQPLKNNINHSYDSEPIQGRSFKVLQQITEPKGVLYDGTQPYNSQSLPLSELRKLQLSDDDRSFMNRVKSQANNLDTENPRYRGGSIPSKIFKVLENSVPMDNSNYKQSAPINNYVSVEPIESKIYVPPSERPVVSEPHKYTGGSIPSRSFRILQAMTGQNNEEEEEQQQNDLLNLQSHTPYPFLCPEFWQHYNYLKEFHDLHCAGSASVTDQQQYQHQQKQQHHHQYQQQQLVQTGVASAADSINAAYAGHVLNTIAEEEPANDENVSSPFDGDTDTSECEVTVTVTLPLKKVVIETMEQEEQVSTSSPVDFWQQINDGAGGPADTSTSDNVNECSDHEEPSAVVCQTESLLQKPSGAACPPDDQAVGDLQSTDREDDDADSGITTTSSADMTSRPSFDKDVIGGGRSGGVSVGSKKYQRTCTHSRLFDFLQRDDDDDAYDDDGADSSNVISDMRNKPPQSCTSGYSSAATTPSTPSVVGRSRTYESDLARTEYDSYYKSWEYACPYFGYDILPSKAFKTIATRLQNSDGPVATCKSPTTTAAGTITTRFKCPKIPAGEDGS